MLYFFKRLCSENLLNLPYILLRALAIIRFCFSFFVLTVRGIRGCHTDFVLLSPIHVDSEKHPPPFGFFCLQNLALWLCLSSCRHSRMSQQLGNMAMLWDQPASILIQVHNSEIQKAPKIRSFLVDLTHSFGCKTWPEPRKSLFCSLYLLST